MVVLLIALGVFVLLLACINFMNIATARSEQRSREVGVRKVLGVSRKLIAFQFLTEAILMTLLALVLAIFIVELVLPSFNQFTEKNIEFNFSDWKVWSLMVAISLFTGLVSGSYPSFIMSRFKAIKVLKGRFAEGRSSAGLRKTLVTVQFVISIFFIIATIVIYKQINYVKNRPLGYDQENLIDISANAGLANKFGIFKNELAEIPGVKSVTAGSDNILNFGGAVTGINYPGKIPGQEISIIVSSVQYDWTKTMGITMLEGRDFSPLFTTDTTACIINEAAVKKMGLKTPVVGTKLDNTTIVGVFKDFVYNNPSGIIAPMKISLQTGGLSHFFVRITNNDQWRQTVAQIEKASKKIAPEYPFEYSFTKADYNERFDKWSSIGALATLFGSMAIFIACLGLFGFSSFLAERRGKEMSIRKVFGASAKTVWLLLSGDFLKPVFIAIAITIPVGIWLVRMLLSNITYHTALDWWMFALAGGLAIIIALITVGFQAIRAAITSPIKSLQSE
ncbi:FtsX-like permease family protein [Ferruginibacter sp.]|uniref:FtsX-like permease family protein n=1 Tax=Ferruginibacter sp. TaxID=1940288 RepID=UPI0034661872